jgi:hypothetical protein
VRHHEDVGVGDAARAGGRGHSRDRIVAFGIEGHQRCRASIQRQARRPPLRWPCAAVSQVPALPRQMVTGSADGSLPARSRSCRRCGGPSRERMQQVQARRREQIAQAREQLRFEAEHVGGAASRFRGARRGSPQAWTRASRGARRPRPRAILAQILIGRRTVSETLDGWVRAACRGFSCLVHWSGLNWRAIVLPRRCAP